MEPGCGGRGEGKRAEEPPQRSWPGAEPRPCDVTISCEAGAAAARRQQLVPGLCAAPTALTGGSRRGVRRAALGRRPRPGGRSGVLGQVTWGRGEGFVLPEGPSQADPLRG